ncbi:MAG: C39 family peptidase [Planctomycetota bacterium]|nr:C39 family peptidase [Planctomycetota bacterium]
MTGFARASLASRIVRGSPRAAWSRVLRGAFIGAILAFAPGCASGPARSTVDAPLTEFIHTSAVGDMRASVSAASPLVSEPISIERGFTEAILSANADVPAGSGIVVEIRVGQSAAVSADHAEFWSPWMPMMSWGQPVPDAPDSASSFGGADEPRRGKIDIDTFVAPAAARFDRLAWRVRATGAAASTVRRIAWTTTAESGTRSWSETLADARRAAEANRPLPNQRLRTLDVPHRSQRTDRAELAGRLCSPTSVAMVLAYRGKPVPVLGVAECAYDAAHDVYGNWARNIQAAYTLGVPGYLTRISSWSEAEAFIARGTPLVISVRFGPGELPAAFEKTDGHLIVLTGFTPEGDATVNDPAFGDEREGRRVYPRADLERAWMSNTAGTTYVLGE